MKSENVIPLGERLKARREELGLSQAEVARELDVARTAYRLWELEAAKPAPDRWRLIARWLGVSVATMLLAEDLIDEDEATAAEVVSDQMIAQGVSWDLSAAEESGDFFAQERTTITQQRRRGMVTPAESKRLREVVSRLQAGARTGGVASPAELHKGLPRDERAPSIARMAVLIAAAGVPSEILLDAEALTSELVTNSVQHATGERIWLDVVLDDATLRVAVTDDATRSARPREPDVTGGFGLTLVMELATRWGAGRMDGKNLTWFEIDL